MRSPNRRRRAISDAPMDRRSLRIAGELSGSPASSRRARWATTGSAWAQSESSRDNAYPGGAGVQTPGTPLNVVPVQVVSGS